MVTLLLSLLLAAPNAHGAMLKASPDSDIAETLGSLEAHANGEGSDLLEDGPAARQLLEQLHQEEQALMIAAVRNDKDDSAIHPDFARFSYINFSWLTFTLERLGKNDFIASTDEDVLLLSRQGTNVQIVWSARRDGVKSAGKYPFLKAWADAAKFTGCTERTWGECGRLGASFGLLPDSAAGHHRFILDGVYRRDTVAVTEHQFSLWDWGPAGVTPLLGSMITAGQEDELFTFGATLIQVPILLQRPVHFVGLAASSWVIQVTPNGVTDRGTGVIPAEQVRQDP
jgi:hypothetical protein